MPHIPHPSMFNDGDGNEEYEAGIQGTICIVNATASTIATIEAADHNDRMDWSEEFDHATLAGGAGWRGGSDARGQDV